MTKVRTRRPRAPAGTREVILKAVRAALAKDGLEGISVSAVATLAGVNRGIAYQHFETREDLVLATTKSVSDQLFLAAFRDLETVKRRVEEVDITHLTMTLADFAVDNPALCRIWFLQLLASDEPSQDPFWREYAGSFHRFTQTDMAKSGIDSEVLSLMLLETSCGRSGPRPMRRPRTSAAPWPAASPTSASAFRCTARYGRSIPRDRRSFSRSATRTSGQGSPSPRRVAGGR